MLCFHNYWNSYNPSRKFVRYTRTRVHPYTASCTATTCVFLPSANHFSRDYTVFHPWALAAITAWASSAWINVQLISTPSRVMRLNWHEGTLLPQTQRRYQLDHCLVSTNIDVYWQLFGCKTSIEAKGTAAFLAIEGFQWHDSVIPKQPGPTENFTPWKLARETSWPLGVAGPVANGLALSFVKTLLCPNAILFCWTCPMLFWLLANFCGIF